MPTIISDPSATTGSITLADTLSTIVSNLSGQSITTGTPASGSTVITTFSTHTSFTVILSGTYNMITKFERSMDGGTTWIPQAMELVSLGTTITFLTETDNYPTILRGSAGALTQFRVRCTTYTSGTCSVRVQPSSYELETGSRKPSKLTSFYNFILS